VNIENIVKKKDPREFESFMVPIPLMGSKSFPELVRTTPWSARSTATKRFRSETIWEEAPESRMKLELDLDIDE
jgi:hypothetical protein